jgi:hypothetical protein
LIRRFIFAVGLLLFLAGAATDFEQIPMPVDLRGITVSVGPAAFSLDVVFMVAGVFMILIAWVFTRLKQ